MTTWRKSSYSDGNTDCVEIGWHKSSHSSGNTDCVEVGPTATNTLVRDSKNTTGPTLAFPTSTWQHFVTGV